MKLTPASISAHQRAGYCGESVKPGVQGKNRWWSFGSHDMFIAEILGVTVDDRYMDEKGTLPFK